MKKTAKQTKNDELSDHYDFSGGVRGKHHNRFAKGTNLVLLAPDVAKVFNDAESVNSALRALIAVAGKIPRKVAESA